MRLLNWLTLEAYYKSGLLLKYRLVMLSCLVNVFVYVLIGRGCAGDQRRLDRIILTDSMLESQDLLKRRYGDC